MSAGHSLSPLTLLLVSYGFPPASHSGVFRPASFAEHLPKLGIRVVVLTATDELTSVLHYPEQEGETGVEVVRVPFKSPAGRMVSAGRRAFRRVPGLAGLAKNRALQHRAIEIWTRAKKQRSFVDVDVVLATSPPPVVAVLGDLIARSLGIPCVCDLRDPWTYYMGAVYRSQLDLRVEASLERRTLSRASSVIVNTRAAASAVIDDFSLPRAAVEVIPNGFDEAKCSAIERRLRAMPASSYFDVVYAGLGSYRERRAPSRRRRIKSAIGLDVTPVEVDYNTRSPLYVLSALEEAASVNPRLRQALRLRWLGPLDLPTRRLLQSYENKFCIDAPGGVTEEEALAAVFAAQLVLVLQVEMRRGGRDACTAIPAKVFSCLRSGNPILAPVQESDLADVLRAYEHCVVVTPRDTHQMATKIQDYFTAWDKRGRGWAPVSDRREALQEYERGALAKQLATIVARIAAPVRSVGQV